MVPPVAGETSAGEASSSGKYTQLFKGDGSKEEVMVEAQRQDMMKELVLTYKTKEADLQATLDG